MGNLAISHEDAIQAINDLSVVVDDKANDPSTSMANLISRFTEVLDEMDSKIAKSYSERLKTASSNSLHPTHMALQAISATMKEAQEHANTRNPEVRKKIASSLKKVPAAIDYIIGQLDIFSADFRAAQDNFRAELEHQRAMVPENMRAHQDENAAILKHLEAIDTVFNHTAMPIHNFRSQHIRIKNLAARLEKSFMNPPSATSETGLGLG